VSQILQQHAGGSPGVYRVQRQEAALLLSGARANDVLVETCGYDFRQPGNRLIMTRVAGVSCAILPIEAGGISMFRLWLDYSYGVYLWEALYEIVRDHGGDVVGMSTVQEAITAIHAGIKVFAVSVVTDIGIRDEENKITHEEVLAAAANAEPKMTALLKEMIAVCDR
jgi:hypothetical protein